MSCVDSFLRSLNSLDKSANGTIFRFSLHKFGVFKAEEYSITKKDNLLYASWNMNCPRQHGMELFVNEVKNLDFCGVSMITCRPLIKK